MRIYTNVIEKEGEVLAVVLQNKEGPHFLCNKHFTPSLYTEQDFIYLPPKLVTHHSWGNKVKNIWDTPGNKEEYLRQLKLSQCWISLSDFEERLSAMVGPDNIYLLITSQEKTFQSLFPEEKTARIQDNDLAWNKIFRKYVK